MSFYKIKTSIVSILLRAGMFLLIWWLITDGAVNSWWGEFTFNVGQNRQWQIGPLMMNRGLKFQSPTEVYIPEVSLIHFQLNLL